MDINDLYKVTGHGDQDRFISLIPGTELSECIESIIDYCKENNTSALLEFNGVINRIESWVDPVELAKAWFSGSGASKEWYAEQKIKERNKRIDQVTKSSE